MSRPPTITRGNSIIDWGFDAQGGFFAIDHLTFHAVYAYPTSPHADMAKDRPVRVVKEMLDGAEATTISKEMRMRHYNTVCRNAHPTTHRDELTE